MKNNLKQDLLFCKILGRVPQKGFVFKLLIELLLIDFRKLLEKLGKSFTSPNDFFSIFLIKILNELKENVTTAVTLFDSIKSSNQWVNRWDEYLSHQSIIDFLKNNKDSGPTKTQVDLVNQEAKKYIK